MSHVAFEQILFFPFQSALSRSKITLNLLTFISKENKECDFGANMGFLGAKQVSKRKLLGTDNKKQAYGRAVFVAVRC